MIPGQRMATGAVAVSTNGAAPRCEHLDNVALVGPRADDCLDCRHGSEGNGREGNGSEANGTRASLVTCLTCGWVACSDDSPHQHARAHYEETDHPVVAGLAPGSAWRWCYVHQRLV